MPYFVRLASSSPKIYIAKSHAQHLNQNIYSKNCLDARITKTRLDHAILQVLREAGTMGALPSKIAYQLRTYEVDRFKVTRHIKAINRRLQKELGYNAAEKVGHRWALTDFLVDVWGVEKEDIKRQTLQ